MLVGTHSGDKTKYKFNDLRILSLINFLSGLHLHTVASDRGVIHMDLYFTNLNENSQLSRRGKQQSLVSARKCYHTQHDRSPRHVHTFPTVKGNNFLLLLGLAVRLQSEISSSPSRIRKQDASPDLPSEAHD